MRKTRGMRAQMRDSGGVRTNEVVRDSKRGSKVLCAHKAKTRRDASVTFNLFDGIFAHFVN